MSHYYKNLPSDQLDELNSTFLIDSWSYSKVSTFVRHQKAFEMEYIFGLKGKRSASSVAGNGYHTALDYFFSQYGEGILIELPAMEQAAFEDIGSIPANRWKLQKTTPTMEQAVEKALKDVNKLLKNFYSERGVYLDELAEILGVELYFDEFMTVNGVDIPLPCHGKIDLIIKTKSGKIVIIDHKSKDTYTDEKEAALVIGIQAITYALGYEAKIGQRVDEVWFVENKSSENKSGAPQLQTISVVMDDNARKMYETLLYESLREMITAVRDPDHVYTINPADKYVDMAEIYDFWSRTMICEVEDFNVEEGKKELVAKRLRKIRNSDTLMISPEIIKKFREKAATFIQYDLSFTNMTAQEKIVHVLKTFGIESRVANFFEGYSSNTFLLEVGAGVKVGNIHKYRLDIANGLNVENVRISNQLVVYESRSYLSIEIAKKRDRDLIFNSADLIDYKIPLGKDNYGNVIFWDLDNHSTPHMLICGATGAGKSVEVRSIIEYGRQAGITDIIILDPKFEFVKMANSKIIVVNDIADIEAIVQSLIEEMESRVRSGKKSKILIIFDEFADAFANARSGAELKKYEDVMEITPRGFKTKRVQSGSDKTLEENIRILLQKGRSCGFRIVAATQRASVKVITGDAKVNFPVQVCFRVPKEADSRVVLDESGAELLQGQGDGLIKSPEYRDTVRFQAYYKPEDITVYH